MDDLPRYIVSGTTLTPVKSVSAAPSRTPRHIISHNKCSTTPCGHTRDLSSDGLRASGGAAPFIRLRRGRSPYEVLASSRGRNQTSAEAEADGLPAHSCACRLGCALSKHAGRRYLAGLLYGGDPSGSDKQIQVDYNPRRSNIGVY